MLQQIKKETEILLEQDKEDPDHLVVCKTSYIKDVSKLIEEYEELSDKLDDALLDIEHLKEDDYNNFDESTYGGMKGDL